MSTKKSKWYVIYRGRRVGVYDNWRECEQETRGFPDAKFASFDTYEEARCSFLKECICGGGDCEWVQKAFPSICTSSPSGDTWRTCEGGPEIPCVCTDAACTNPVGGDVEYRCVRISNKTAAVEQLFAFGPFRLGSNNIGEYVGLVRALMWTSTHDSLGSAPIYTDSRVAISWVSNPVAPGSNTTIKAIGDDLRAELKYCDDWIKTPVAKKEVLKRVRHWKTSCWGEIPADYGRK